MPISAPTDIPNLALWLDAADLTTLWQEIAGTTPVSADGQAVGKWDDKSGNGFHLTATADSGVRPVYNTDGDGPRVTFDGTDAVLRRTADLGLYAAGAASLFVRLRANPGGVFATFDSSGNTADGDVLYSLMVADNPTVANATAAIRNTANTNLFTIGTDLQAGAFDNTDHVYGVIDDGSSLTPWLDGVEGSPVGYTRSGSVASDIFGIGALVRATIANYFATRLYGLAAYTRALDDTEAADISDWLVNGPGGGAPEPASRRGAGGMNRMTGGMQARRRNSGLYVPERRVVVPGWQAPKRQPMRLEMR
jgi:hypothetical protein